MTPFDLTIYLLKFYIPSMFIFLFRAFALGHKSKKHLVIGLSAYTAYIMIVPAVLISIMGYGEFTHIVSFVMLLSNFFVLIFSTQNFAITIFLQLLLSQVNTSISMIINTVRTVKSFTYVTLDVILFIVFLVLFFFAMRYLKKPLLFIADNTKSGKSVLVILPVLVYVAVSLIPIYPENNFATHPVWCTSLVLIIDVCFFLFVYLMYCNMKRIAYLERVQGHQKILEAELSAYDNYLSDARQNRHDIRHHNTLLLDLLHNGEIDRAKEYLSQSEEYLKTSALREYCENKAANAILRAYDGRCERDSINYIVEAEIPQEISLHLHELLSVLSNLLENAWKSCNECNNVEKFISVSVATEENILHIEIHNSVGGTVCFENGIPVSNRKGGGIGIQSISSIINKHNGMIRFIQEDKEFIVQAILPLTNS